MKLIISTLLCLTLCHSEVLSLNILGIFPYAGKSHFFLFKPYLLELAKKGHNVTVISYFPQSNPLKNYHDIALSEIDASVGNIFKLERSYKSLIDVGWYLVDSSIDNCKAMLSNKDVQNIWKTKQKFDVAVIELFNSDCGLGIAHQLNVPVVGTTSHVLMQWHYARFGVPYNSAYVPHLFFEGGTKPTLYQRIEKTVFDAYLKFIYRYYSQATNQRTLAEYFDNVPDLEELGKQTKLVLLYTDFVLTGTRVLPTNIKEVGGYHVPEPKPLPADLKKFIEESEHGVIYISFGTMVQATTMPQDKLQDILSALEMVPQRIVWKWDGELAKNSNKFYLAKWLPQNDILAHPNVLAFYSHCGLLGTTEAIHHGVPIIGMPVIGDQPSNAAAIEESGLGVQLPIADLNKESLLKALKIVLNPEFRKSVKSVSSAWRDRPMPPLDTAVYWTEYVARHPNMTYKSAAVDVPLYQFYCLDVYGVLVGIPILLILLIKQLLSSLSNPSVTKKDKRKKN